MRILDSLDIEAASHELKSPISVLLAQLELMNYFLDDSRKLGDLITVASQNAYRIVRLTGNLLDILRIDAGCVRVNFVDADVFSLVTGICDAAGSYAESKSIQLVCECPQYDKVMPIDREKTERILFNLLSNAMKHTEEGGMIVVKAEDQMENGIVLSVEDTGAGIPEDKLRMLIDRSAHACLPLGGKAERAGIGLALVRSFVDIIGGRFTATSKEGEGSRFIVELPITPKTRDTRIAVCGYSIDKRAAIELSDLLSGQS